MSAPSRYQFRSPMPVPAEALWAWHARPGAFERLTPPWEPVSLLARSGDRLENGLRVTLGIGPPPFRLRWVAEHRDCVPGSGFRDVQISGPFALWDHHHRMVQVDKGESVLEDDLTFALPLHGLVRVVAEPVLRRRLEQMFRYRHAVTRSDLEAHAAHAGPPLRVAVGGSGTLANALRHFLTTGGHDVADFSESPEAAVLVAPEPGEPGPSLEGLLRRLPPHEALPRLVLAGRAVPPALVPGRRCAALHLGALVWPGVGWLRWARPFPGLVRGSDDTPRRWISRDEALGAILAALRCDRLDGHFDAAHAEPASDAEIAALLSRRGPAFRIPGRSGPPSPPGAERAPALRAAADGYRLRHLTLADALDHVLGRPGGTPADPPTAPRGERPGGSQRRPL